MVFKDHFFLQNFFLYFSESDLLPSTASDHLDASISVVVDMSSATTPVTSLKVKDEAALLPLSPKIVSQPSKAELMKLQNEALKDWHKVPGNIFTA